MKEIKFTDKATEELEMYNKMLRSWLAYSEMTKKDLYEYKTAEKIYVEKTLDGYCLMCVKDGREEQIGCGLSKYSTDGVEMLFIYIGAILDSQNLFRSHFSKDIAESFNK